MIHPLAEKIDKAIEEHLPAELSNALKKRIQMLDEAITENTALKRKVDDREKELAHARNLNNELNKALAGHVALEVRENAVKAREEKVTVFELKAELEAEKRVATGYKEILGGLVRNIEYRNQVFTNEPVAIPVSGGTGYVVQHQGSKVEEKIAK